MDEPRPVTLLLPVHTQEKLEALREHYLMPVDMLLQKMLVDRVDDVHELVILEPARKKAQA